jgi:hypothetical protein
MQRLHTLYILLLSSALIFQSACDDSDTIENDADNAGTEVAAGETVAGEMTAGETTAGETTAGETTAGETTAGAESGGAETGGEVSGGEMTGGEEPTGGMTGGSEPEARVGPGDTEALSCMGDYCPSARLSALSLPQTPADATASGCRLASDKNGTALGGLLMLAGDVDTNEFVTPNASGEIELILLNHLDGWMSGATGNDAGTFSSKFYTGVQVDSGFEIDPVSFDESGNPIIYFDGTSVVDGLYQTPPSDFRVSLPLAGLDLELRLSQTEVNGFVTVDETGFNMTEGVLGGYLTKDAILELIQGITDLCDPNAENRPELCDTVSSVLSGNAESDLILLTSILGGFDSAVNGSDVSACAGDSPDCNAISVCILLEMESAKISGIYEE